MTAGIAGWALAQAPLPAAAAAGGATATADTQLALEQAAAAAYADRDFQRAVEALNRLLALEPQSLRWREMRAQALVDGKNFSSALTDFDFVLSHLPSAGAEVDRARLLAGRGLAYEGLGDWAAALKDYQEAMAGALDAGQLPDPYVANSIGNCYVSLGDWAKARDAFLASAEGFQSATGFGRTNRLDGAIFAASNAALMLAQLGDEERAMKEMQAIARRAPGSVDMRAALAALYWREGQEGAAEAEWEFACTRITVGCTKYTDADWLARIRRWPPVMQDYLQNFLSLRSSGARGGGGGGARAAFKE